MQQLRGLAPSRHEGRARAGGVRQVCELPALRRRVPERRGDHSSLAAAGELACGAERIWSPSKPAALPDPLVLPGGHRWHLPHFQLQQLAECCLRQRPLRLRHAGRHVRSGRGLRIFVGHFDGSRDTQCAVDRVRRGAGGGYLHDLSLGWLCGVGRHLRVALGGIWQALEKASHAHTARALAGLTTGYIVREVEQ
eukprot:UN0672